VTGWWFSPGTPVSSSNKTDRHDIAEILLNLALNPLTINITHNYLSWLGIFGRELSQHYKMIHPV